MTVGGREEQDSRLEDEERGDTDEGGVDGGERERVSDAGEKGEEEHRTEERAEEALGGRSPP